MHGMKLQSTLWEGFAAAHRRAAGCMGLHRGVSQVTAIMTWQGGLNVPGAHAHERQTELRNATACCIRDDGLR